MLRMSALFVSLGLVAGFAAPRAHANGSWLNQPSWTNDEPGSPRKSSGSNLMRERREPQVAPFTPGSNNVSLDLGQVFLMGNYGSKYSDAIGARLHYTYGVSDLFGFDSSIGYSEHQDGDFSMVSLLTGLRMNLSWYDKVIPYAVFGLGFYKPSFTINGAGNKSVTEISPVLFGVHLGPGVDLELTRQIFFGAALDFHDVFGTTKSTPNGPLDVGGTFTSFLVHAGYTF